jgi:hypothetical protein
MTIAELLTLAERSGLSHDTEIVLGSSNEDFLNGVYAEIVPVEFDENGCRTPSENTDNPKVIALDDGR